VGTLIQSTTITPSVENTYLLANAACEFSNTNNNTTYTVTVYMVVDGTTSSSTTTNVLANNTIGGATSYASVSIIQSAQITTIQSYTVSVYAYTNAPTTSVLSTHTDLSVLGNINSSP
jgi:hypothetical protein